MCMTVLTSCIVYIMCMPVPMEARRHWTLELQTVVSHQVGTENQT